MSVRFPPHVELIRPGVRKTFSLDLQDTPAGRRHSELDFLTERNDVRSEAQLLVAPGRAGGASPGLHLVEDDSVPCRWHISWMASRNSDRRCRSPPSHCMGSAMKQAMSCS